MRFAFDAMEGMIYQIRDKNQASLVRPYMKFHSVVFTGYRDGFDMQWSVDSEIPGGQILNNRSFYHLIFVVILKIYIP